MKAVKKDAQSKKTSRGFQALQKTCFDFGQCFTKGTSAIADAILDRTVTEKKERLVKVRTASWKFVKELASGLQQDLKEVSFVAVMADASYETGKVSAVVKIVSGKTWNMLMKKLDEDRS